MRFQRDRSPLFHGGGGTAELNAADRNGDDRDRADSDFCTGGDNDVGSTFPQGIKGSLIVHIHNGIVTAVIGNRRIFRLDCYRK